MTNTHPHLTANAAARLSEPNAGCIRAIRSRRWVLYPRAKQALERLEALLEHPRGVRMPSIAIYGDSGIGIGIGIGKTMIMQRFRDQHPPVLDRWTGVLKTPVLTMEMISRPGRAAVLRRASHPPGRAAGTTGRYRPDGAGRSAHHEGRRRSGAGHR